LIIHWLFASKYQWIALRKFSVGAHVYTYKDETVVIVIARFINGRIYHFLLFYVKKKNNKISSYIEDFQNEEIDHFNGNCLSGIKDDWTILFNNLIQSNLFIMIWSIIRMIDYDLRSYSLLSSILSKYYTEQQQKRKQTRIGNLPSEKRKSVNLTECILYRYDDKILFEKDRNPFGKNNRWSRRKRKKIIVNSV
jgi:hypothetical protein